MTKPCAGTIHSWRTLCGLWTTADIRSPSPRSSLRQMFRSFTSLLTGLLSRQRDLLHPVQPQKLQGGIPPGLFSIAPRSPTSPQKRHENTKNNQKQKTKHSTNSKNEIFCDKNSQNQKVEERVFWHTPKNAFLRSGVGFFGAKTGRA